MHLNCRTAAGHRLAGRALRFGLSLGVVACLPTLASAHEIEQESPRSTYIDLRLGPYKPGVDSQFSGDESVRPYRRIFKDESPILFMLSLERHILQDFGTLSLGLAAGYWTVEGQGISEGAKDSTELMVIPTQLQLSYRLDPWQDIVPLVPMVRLGLDYNLWRIYDGEGNVTSFAPGKEASGGTLGWHVSVGLLLALDFFDTEMAADFDRDAGVNTSYLLFEMQYSQIDNFGKAGAMRFGGTTFFGGLGLDF